MIILLLGLLALIAALLLICCVRALALKPTPAAAARIDRAADARDLSYGQRLGRMLACETVSEREKANLNKFVAFHRVLEETFPALHAACERHVFDDESLLYRWPGGAGQPLLLMSHQDVVEATGNWRHPPFSGVVEDGRVWGRGAVDTKGNLFCIMQAAEELIGEGFTPGCDIYIASSANEEIAGPGAPAACAFLEKNGVRLRLVLDEGGMIMEKPIGGLNGTYGVVGVLEKGYADVKLVARSGGGHSSSPEKNTPLVRLGRLMARLDGRSPYRAKLNPTVEEMLRRFAPNMALSLKIVMANLWLFRPILPMLLDAVSHVAAAMVRTTIAFTTARGSDGLNVLPQEAFVTANLRFIPHQDQRESLEILTALAKKYDIETLVLESRPACPVVSFESDAFRLIEATMAEVYPGVGVTPYTMTGATDARHFTGICDHVLRFAPLYINQQQFKSIHGLDENIDCAALGLGVDFFRRLIEKA